MESLPPNSATGIPPNFCVSTDTSEKDAVASNLLSALANVKSPSILTEPVISTEPVIICGVFKSLPMLIDWETKREPDIETLLFTDIESLKILTSSICFCGINLAIIIESLQFYL